MNYLHIENLETGEKEMIVGFADTLGLTSKSLTKGQRFKLTVEKEIDNCVLDDVIPCFFVALVYQNSSATMLRTFVTEARNEEEALSKSIEYFSEETKDYGLVMKTVTTPNKG